MRYNLLTLIAVLSMVLGAGCGPAPDAPESILKNADARQAMALANQWKWSQKEIKSHVDSREVVFERSGDIIKRISLPADRMIVAVAPYINTTHQ